MTGSRVCIAIVNTHITIVAIGSVDLGLHDIVRVQSRH
jgi:hypothetical protein